MENVPERSDTIAPLRSAHESPCVSFPSVSSLALARRVRAQAADIRPNFVFIMADDMGPFDLGCYGQTEIRTPHIDRAAAEGMRFTNCYAGASVCAPSRSVLMTGQHTGHTTVRANASLLTGERVPLRKEDRTIASVLKGPEWRDAYDEERAYATAHFGKWGLGEPGTTGLPNDHGFDEFFGFLNQQHAHEHYPKYLWRNKSKEFLRGNRNGEKREYASDLMAREALYFIDRHRYEPFFLYFSPTVPHAKLEAPELGEYASKPWPDSAKNYAAMVTRFDSYVGRILEKLKETGLDERTVVFIASDNGGTSEFGPFASLGRFKGKKGVVYEGGFRVPMIALAGEDPRGRYQRSALGISGCAAHVGGHGRDARIPARYRRTLRAADAARKDTGSQRPAVLGAGVPAWS